MEERDQEIHSPCTKPSHFPSTPLLNIPWNKSPLWCSKNKAYSRQDKLHSLKERGQILLTATPSLRQQGCTCVWIVKPSLNIQGHTVISCILLTRDQQLQDRGQRHRSGLRCCCGATSMFLLLPPPPIRGATSDFTLPVPSLASFLLNF